MGKKTRNCRGSIGLAPLVPSRRHVPANSGKTPSSAPSFDETARSASRRVIVDEHLRPIDLSLDTKGFYMFSYNSFEIRLDSTRGSGVLISTIIRTASENGETSSSNSRDQRLSFITKLIELNRKIHSQTEGSAIVGIIDCGVEFYYHCHSNPEAEVVPLSFDELECCLLDFMRIVDKYRVEFCELCGD